MAEVSVALTVTDDGRDLIVFVSCEVAKFFRQTFFLGEQGGYAGVR